MGYAKEKFEELLGCTPAGGGKPPKDWTPNNIRSLFLHETRFHAVLHVGEDVEIELIADLDEPEGGDIFKELHERAYGGLENLFVSDAIRALGDFSRVVTEYSDRRLHRVGNIADPYGFPNGTSITVDQDINPDWKERIVLQPETYEKDADKGELRKVLESYRAPAEEEVSDLEDEVYKYLAGRVKASAKNIIEEYTRIFSSGYEVVKPYGILSEDEHGLGVALRLEGNRLVVEPHDTIVQEAWTEIKSRMQLNVVQSRSILEIANILTTGYPGNDKSGKPVRGHLYFPQKMLEYAFGREKAKSSSTGDDDFPPASTSSSWKSYSQGDIRTSLEDVLKKILYKELETRGLLDPRGRASQEGREAVQNCLETIKQTFCTVVLISKFEVMNDEPAILKIRVLDPYSALSRTENLATVAMERGMGGYGGGDDSKSFPVVSKHPFYVEYSHEADHTLANAEPLYAFKALEALQRQGEGPSWDNLILGVAEDDTIMRAGTSIDLGLNLTHHICAGSRSGKGVMTLNILASGILSGKPILYTDNKPDMASLMLQLSPKAYAINGQDLIHDPAGGTDAFSTFQNANSWLNSAHLPSYTQDLFGGRTWQDVGKMIYVRSTLLSMAVIAARVKSPAHYESLGGSKGIVVVADELTNASSQLSTFLAKGTKKHLVGQDYTVRMQKHNEAVAAYENNETRKKPEDQNPKNLATEADMWFTMFYEKLEESINLLQELSNAGLKNGESKISDVFVLSQTIFDPAETINDVAKYFMPRNITKTGIAGAPDKSDALASLVMVGGTDAILGFHAKNDKLLAQNNRASAAYGKLDATARNFAYVENFQGQSKREATNGSIEASKRAVYFKPFLIFSSSSKEYPYFVDNSLDYARQAGVDPKKIIAKNANPDNPEEIHPAVGFEQYLNMAGISSEEISATLEKGGDIAQYVVSQIGYPGTWKEFLLDLRPEWIFSIPDVLRALDGEKFLETTPVRLADFYTSFPDAFEDGGAAASGGSGGGGASNPFSDEDIENESSGDSENWDADSDDEEEGSSWGNEDETEVIPTVDSETPYTPDSGAEGAEGAGSPFGSPGGSGAGSGASGGGFGGGEPIVVDGEEVYSPPVSWDSEGNSSTPEGSYGFQGQPQTLDNVVKPPAQFVDMAGSRFTGSSEDMAELVSRVSDDIIRSAGGMGSVRSLSVIGGSLVVNGNLYQCRMSPTYLEQLPGTLSAEIQTGNVAKLFNWGLLRRLQGVASLQFETAEFVYDHVSLQMGWGARVSANLFFEDIRTLSRLNIRGVEYTRSTYKRQLKEDQTFYQPVAIRHAADVVEAACFSGTRNSWKRAGNVFSRKDIGFWSKMVRAGGWAGASVVTGTAAVATAGTARASRGLFGALKGIGRDIGDMLKDDSSR